MSFVADEAARLQAIADLGADVALVTPDLPLRVNLPGAEIVALAWQYHGRMAERPALKRARDLLAQLGHPDAAGKRDEDMRPIERFAVKLARAATLDRPRLVIDRPALLLPDVFYPEAVRALVDRLAGTKGECVVIDFIWNRSLWNTHGSDET